MLVSLKSVNQYVDIKDLSAEEIADKLTFAGVEVEEIKKLASGTNLVIGEVKECVAHPNSDHLHVLKVDLGPKYGVTQIVCGAPNARAGLRVIVARVGAVLPQIEIKQGIIRGEESNGMCCSLLELGVDAKYLSDYQKAGIEELPADAPVGEEDVLGYLGLDDVVLNLKVLANRPDLLSIFNVAREIGAIFNRKVNIPTVKSKEDFKTKLVVGSKTKRCSQFSGKEIKGIITKPSPKWMSELLMAMGVRSINNIVDIGNYVMLMTGQPLHMYDADKLAKAELYAQDDYDGDFVALDEKTYKVIPGDIVICCDNKPMCLGGVMGSLACAVDENTKNIYIEAASFDGASIRHTSNRLGLASESSQRFVKGTNHFQSEFVLDYAAELINELCEAKSNSNNVVYQSEEDKDNVVACSIEKINNRLGTSFSKEQIVETLSKLNFELKFKNDNEFVARVPKYRLDVTCDADLSEEVIRLLGYENVKSILPCLDTKVGMLTQRQQRLKNIRSYLLANGLDECLTYSLISKKEENDFCLLNKEEKYVIINPLTDEHEVFRTHILSSLLKVATYNVARQNKNLAIFETSNMISKASRSEHLAIVLVGQALKQGLMEEENYSFYHMKGLVDGLFTSLGIEGSRYRFDRFVDEGHELHPGKSANIIFQNKVIGVMGELHPNQIEKYDLGKSSAVVLEMDLEALLEAKVSETKMSPISRFPSVSRDLAFVLDASIPASDVIKTIKTVGRGLVNNCEVFDVYQGTGIAEGKKSMALSVTYRKEDGTLTDKEIGDIEDKIKFELSRSYKAEIRS
ncbi:MAG: phenylalanine--tRNA ligase subunit beta [Bacilli bacterium]|nr:phenylalanine--tRNA ligase subunit beta [Bacilli bacterium]